MIESCLRDTERGQVKVVTLTLLLALVVGTSAAVLGGVTDFAENTARSEAVDADVEFVEVVEPGNSEPSSIVATVGSVNENVDAIEIEALETGESGVISDPVAGDSIQLPESGELDAGDQIIASAVTEDTSEVVNRHTFSEEPDAETIDGAVDGGGGGISGSNFDIQVDDENEEEGEE